MSLRHTGRTFALLVTCLFLAVGALQLVAGTPEPDASPAVVGRWLPPFEGEVPAVNMAVLPDGRILYYSGVEADESDDDPTHLTFMLGTQPLQGRSRILDVTGYAGGTVQYSVSVPDPESGGAGDLFCSGITIRADGKVISPGATEWFTLDENDPLQAANAPLKGLNQTRLFDPADGSWSDAGDMAVGRWYPSAISLADGTTLVASGIQTLVWPNTHNNLVETHDGAGWSSLETRLDVAGVPIEQGGRVADHTGPTPLEPIGETGLSPMNLPMYPRLFQVSGGPLEGQVFYSTVGTLWGPFGERADEALWSLQQTLDLDTGTWTMLGPSAFGARQHAASVPLLLDGANDYAPKIVTFGGTLQRSVLATPLAEVADLSTNPPTNTVVDPMHNARWHLNGVLLPDGKVAAIGGGAFDNVVLHGAPNVAANAAELFDPATGEWTEMAEASVDRMYHSTAVLLPDGRVLAGGHVPLPAFSKLQRDTVNPQVVETRFEIFEPPYLFLDDSRPRIDYAPARGTYGETLLVEVEHLEGGVHSVVLMRPGATTHAYDADQRGVVLDARVVGSGQSGTTLLEVTLPPRATVAPPGHYMLFVNEDVDGQAFPSEAAFVRVA